jgi:DNA repair photolyase
LFSAWLDEHYPLRKQKVLNRIREVRGGKLYDADFSSRMVGEGVYADYVRDIFEKSRAKYGLDRGRHTLSTAHFRKAPEAQLALF